MTGGVSGAASGGILGLVLVLLAQQFGYATFTGLEQTLILLILVILVFAVVFGLLGRLLKASAIRRAKAGAEPTIEPNSGGGPAPGASDMGTPPAAPPPSDPGAPPSA